MSLLTILTSCLFGQGKTTFNSVSVDEFKKIIADSTVILVDVRTPEEFQEGHIPNTKYNIDALDSKFLENATKLLPEGASVAIYCRSGNRSKAAAKKLAGAGYKVTELNAGYKAWLAQ